MILVGLTGGIGSGKSTVSAMLVERGAVLIDADAITREVQQPGRPLVAALAERFGADVVDSHGALVRARLAEIVFADPEALKVLNEIVHPAVGAEMAARIEGQRGSDAVVVLDVALLAENPRRGLAATVVVDCPIDIAVQRLVEFRSMDETDARARIARQATREARLAIADLVIDNSGAPDDLITQVDDVWRHLRTLPATTDEDLALYRKRP